MENLLYTIYPAKQTSEEIIELLNANSNIKFVSLVAVDLGNNHTDEKIPMEIMLEDYSAFIEKGIQTDGSSVYLPIIAEINNAKVDLIPDTSVRWIVDYNGAHIDENTNLPVGTLIIPAFLKHEGVYVDSRSVLKAAVSHFETSVKELLIKTPSACTHLGIQSADEIAKVVLTTATELEFWVKTPDYTTDIEKLSTSQSLKEQYWKRTVGPVRTAMEKSLLALNHYDYIAEMGHKEVGGVPARLKRANDFSHVMEQLEIDWKYDSAMQTADNELFARDIISDIFVKEGLEVTFRAKPIEGVAGSGEHHHMGVGVITTSGKFINLFAPQDMKSDYLNPFGYGALMGILNNYEVINPFVTSTNDAFNRLKPGFEAPVCIVGSLGHSVSEPSRNRTVLIGLVRDIEQPAATRFELRAPNPTSNTYLLTAACYQGMLDGMKYSVSSEKSTSELLKELRKEAGQAADYLDPSRMYLSEEDVFEHYTSEERDALFSKPPRNVFENISSFKTFENKLTVLKDGNVFTPSIIASYEATLLGQWTTELGNRILPENVDLVRSCNRLHKLDDETITDVDVVRWEAIHALRKELMKDSLSNKSLFTQIREAIGTLNYERVSYLQVNMSEKTTELRDLFISYKQNLFIID
ncbi:MULTISPECIES: glutamine synthetase [unclassified Fusibacter]|uniref:glutamine synthetase n=1 Tax=unclassified Fusibacter TaxID=2624464 RepID=UPI0010136662|nr:MULTISPECIES: glutamine synthetase [unclassified Fusibacter]MCK8061014.1 glutamine synthetase [Fusibacter sp. A2]NPE20532.1 glutamine synthetase [Fusibacter sp. A1]RXV63730.1 glutamine synthetase [Fusibacter sp. A1]